MSSRTVPFLLQDFQFVTATSVVEYAEKNFVIPRVMSPAHPGPYKSSFQPTSRPILECFRPDSGVRMLSSTGGAQIAKTTDVIIGTGYRIRHSPMPQLILAPSEDWMRLELSEKRLMALINENPVLSCMKPGDPSRFRKMAMEMVGGTIALEGAGSPTATSGSTQGIVWIEEAAKIEHRESEDNPEAHPIKLAFERTKMFRGLELQILTFTPNSPSNLAWQYHLSGTQTHFYVPCPHCGEHFPFEFELRKGGDLEENLQASQEEAKPDVYRSLVWSPDARERDGRWNEKRIRESCLYICPHNGCEIREEMRRPMIELFTEHHHNQAADLSQRSFRRPSFYASSITFADMALEFLKRGDLFTTGLQNYFNSWLALPWEKVLTNVKDEDARKLRDLIDYQRNTIPRRPLGLCLTADPGESMTHWEVNAIFDNDEVALIDWGTVLTVDHLPALRGKLKYKIHGTDEWLQPAIGVCDARYETVKVYNMCQASGRFWFPSMGTTAQVGTWGVTHIRAHNLDRYSYRDFALKKELYGNRIKKQTAPRLYFPRNTDEAVIQGHSGQQMIRTNGGEEWKKVPHDHYGDCSKLALLVMLVWKCARGQGAPDIPAEQSAIVPVG